VAGAVAVVVAAGTVVLAGVVAGAVPVSQTQIARQAGQ